MVLQFLSSVCFMIVGISSIIMGIIYITKKEFAKYHKEATKKTWNEIDKNIQIIIIALMKLGGVGFLIAGVATGGSCIAIFSKNLLLLYTCSAISFVFWIGSTIITRQVKQKTGAKTPYLPSLYNSVLVILGIFLHSFTQI